MPYHLKTQLNQPGDIQWWDVWPDEKITREYGRLGTSHGKLPTLQGPIPYKMIEGHLQEGGVLTDLVSGRWSRDLIVSHRVKDMIEAKDRVQHHFIPVDLTLKDGSFVTGQYYIFVAGDLTDAVVPEASNVTPEIIEGQFVYYNCSGEPDITWRPDAIEGRQIWVDKNLLGQIFISDALEAEFRENGLQGYRLRPSSVLIS